MSAPETVVNRFLTRAASCTHRLRRIGPLAVKHLAHGSFEQRLAAK